ncbi:MAG: hypothetical protein WBD22_06335 [Pyrinomonadaceae bacterium]
MTAVKTDHIISRVRFASSLEADKWHPSEGPEAYQCWHFDALSDDGKDAVIITFFDNSVVSRDYAGSLRPGEGPPPRRVPAVQFAYYKDGRPVHRTMNEFGEGDFAAADGRVECSIGDSNFRLESAPYGSGFLVKVSAFLSRSRRIEARFEWLSIEADLRPADATPDNNAHNWNMTSPRSDVTGRIKVLDKNDTETEVIQFRGTGYHDHMLDRRSLTATISERHWGRAHFVDSTAVFHRLRETGDSQPWTRLYIIRDGILREKDVRYEEQLYVRDKFGIKYPSRVRMLTDDNIRLRSKTIKVIDSSFYRLRFISEMTLTLRDGKPRKTIGMSEILAPKVLKYRWLNWLNHLRTVKK